MPLGQYSQYSQPLDSYRLNQPDAPSTDWGGGAAKVGGGAAAGAATGSAILPGWGTAIGAGVGALAGLYGAYRSQDTADQNYKDQVQQWEAQQRLDKAARDKAEADARLQREYDAAQYAGHQRDSRLSRYSSYLTGIGA